MKIIALLPVRNEAWVLRHSLACLSGFCDVILASDQDSEDDSRSVCREFPKVVLFESKERLICEQVRWQLWDAARDYAGENLIWCTDADEVMSPAMAQRFFRSCGELDPGTVIDCLFHQSWESRVRYRDDLTVWRPYWKPVAVRDDRRMDYSRVRDLPLHEERVPVDHAGARLRADIPILHLQWLLPEQNQFKQAWYRCRELIGGAKSVEEINQEYVHTLPATAVKTSPVPGEWIRDVTFPQTAGAKGLSWQAREILGWFDERGVEFFEPLDIWHIRRLRDEFRRRAGRRPRPDLSYRGSWPRRARQYAGGLWRRMRQ